MSESRNVSKSFTAVLEHSGDRLNWTIIRIPLDVAKIWGKRGQLRVKGEINGFTFRTSLFPDGKGGHVLIVNNDCEQEDAGRRQGGFGRTSKVPDGA